VPDTPELRDRIARLPRRPGVYLWKGAGDEVVYVGKAVDLRSRVSSYLDPATPKHEKLLEDAVAVDYIVVRTEKEALVLEQTLIKRHRPRYNVRLTDDKSYPYLKLTNEPYPRLLKVYRREDDDATYFGPFPDGSGAFHVAQSVADLVPLRRCKVLPKEKCLYLDIGKCAGPCIQACTDDEYEGHVKEVRDLLAGKADHLIDRVRERLEGAAAAHRFEDAARLRNQLVSLEQILDRQHMVANRLEERDIAALALQGDLGVVSLLHQEDGKITGQSLFAITGADEPGKGLADFLRGYYQDRHVPRHVACDMDPTLAPALEADLRILRQGPVTVEAPQRGEKMRWIDVARANAGLRLEEERHKRRRRGVGALESLQRALGLATLPRVIEGFDVSHLAGEHTRAAMVRFVDGEPDKAGYRTFGMKTVGAAAVEVGTAVTKGRGRDVDDFASIEEAVGRRLRGLAERHEGLPDLLLIDGGEGQLAAAAAAVRAAGVFVALVSLAKQDERLYTPKRLQPLRLARDDAGLQLLQRVRDEAHRFGITQVRRKATADVLASPLDDVAGIGPTRRSALVRAFGGLEGLRTASVADLQRVPGVSAAMANQILAALSQNEPADDDA
jgi:excinuclease ABC subunit C